MRVLFLSLLLGLLLPQLCISDMLLGANLNELGPWQVQWPFADLMKASSPFLPRSSSGSYMARTSFILSNTTGYPISLSSGAEARNP